MSGQLRSALFVVILHSLSLTLVAQRSVPFLQNRGQWPEPVKFRAEMADATVWIEPAALLIDRFDRNALQQLSHAHVNGMPNGPLSQLIRHHAIRLRFMATNSDPEIEPVGVRPGAFNFLIGNDPSKWASNVHAFSAIDQKNIYPGVDLRIRTDASGLKYDLFLAPDVDPTIVKFLYDGADGITFTNDRLTLATSLGDVIETIPLAYQERDGVRMPVPCHYRKGSGHFGFELGAYDRALPLVIDPTVIFSTYSGSVADNFGYTATFDRDGFLYSGSTAFGQGYPTTTGAFQVTHAGGDGLFDGTDIALTKYDTTGTFLIWSTYIGGSSDELPHSIIVNGSDELFLYGTTSSPNFPVTTGSFDTSFNGGPPVNLTNGLGVNFPNGVDMIVARLSADGSTLLAGTFLGGSQTDGLNTDPGLKFNYADEVRGEVLLDPNDNVYIASCTSSPNMPTTVGSMQPTYGGGTQDGVVLKMDASLTTLFYSTFLGGSLADAIYNVELNGNDGVYVSGGTRSTDLPTTPGALHTTFLGGAADGFVSSINANGSTLVASTYFGTAAYDQCYFADLDQEGNVYLFGQTSALGNELIFNASYNVPNSGQFLSKLDHELTTLLISTRFGQGDGVPDISPTAFLVDYCDKIYVSGWGSAVQGQLSTTGMAVTPNAFQTTTDGNDFYLAVFEIDLSDLYYGTYYGGSVSSEHVDGGTSRFDRRGRVYQSVCAGCGGNSDFPIVPDPGAWSPTNNSGLCNNGVFKLDMDIPMVVADFNSTINCLPDPITFTNASYGANGYQWTFGDGTTSVLASPTHVFPGPGVYTVTLVANNPATCNVNDTTQRQVVVLDNSAIDLNDTTICAGASVQIGVLPINDPSISYAWTPATWLSNANVGNPVATPPQTTTYTLTFGNGACSLTATQTVVVASSILDAGVEQTVCGPNATALLTANGNGTITIFQWSSNANFTDTLNAPLTDSTATIQPMQSGWYFARALDNICGGVDSVRINVSLGDPRLIGENGICSMDTAHLTLSGIDQGATIAWSPAEEILIGQGTPNASVAPVETSTYGVTVTTLAGCTWSGTITVGVSPIMGGTVTATVDQTIVEPGTTVQLMATPTQGTTFSWVPANLVSNPTIPNPTAVVQETTTFTVTVSDGICTKDALVTVQVHDVLCEDPDIFVPNTFTPNNDGNNDVLFVRGRAIQELEFKVFDRWGEKVFETNDQKIGWDGAYKGKPVDPAVFVYHLTVFCSDGQRFFTKGNVTVVR